MDISNINFKGRTVISQLQTADGKNFMDCLSTIYRRFPTNYFRVKPTSKANTINMEVYQEDIYSAVMPLLDEDIFEPLRANYVFKNLVDAEYYNIHGIVPDASAKLEVNNIHKKSMADILKELTKFIKEFNNKNMN